MRLVVNNSTRTPAVYVIWRFFNDHYLRFYPKHEFDELVRKHGNTVIKEGEWTRE